MLAFDFRYRKKLPTPSDSAASKFGTAIHVGVQEWYGGPGPITPENAVAHQDQKLAELIKQQWPELIPPGIWEIVQRLIEFDKECEALASMIVMKRELKAPRQSKDFLSSEVWKDFNDEALHLIEVCDNFNEIHWPRNENAFQAYQKSIAQAYRIESEWKGLPRPLLVEEPFRLELDGYVLRGQVDQVREDPNPAGEPQPQRVRDIKTGKQLMTQMEAFWQAWIYNEATFLMDYEFLKQPIVDFDFYMTRHVGKDNRIKKQEGRIERARHRKLALRILNGVVRNIVNGADEPHYGYHCKQCDFRDLCADEINLWVGDGLEPMADEV